MQHIEALLTDIRLELAKKPSVTALWGMIATTVGIAVALIALFVGVLTYLQASICRIDIWGGAHAGCSEPDEYCRDSKRHMMDLDPGMAAAARRIPAERPVPAAKVERIGTR